MKMNLEETREALEFSDELLKTTSRKLEDKVLEYHKMNRNWFIFWVLTNLVWMLIK